MHLRFITGTRGSTPEFRDEDVGQSRVARPARAKHPWKFRKSKRRRLFY